MCYFLEDNLNCHSDSSHLERSQKLPKKASHILIMASKDDSIILNNVADFQTNKLFDILGFVFNILVC